MAEKFKPGPRNIFLVQGPREDNGNQALAVRAYHGRKSDKFTDSMPITLFGDAHFAFLDQVHVSTPEELQRELAKHHERWVRNYDLSAPKGAGSVSPSDGAEPPATRQASH